MAFRIAFQIWITAILISMVIMLGIALYFNVDDGEYFNALTMIQVILGASLFGMVLTSPGLVLLAIAIHVCTDRSLYGTKAFFAVLISALVIAALNFLGIMLMFDARGSDSQAFLAIVLIPVAFSVVFKRRVLFNLSDPPLTIQPDSHEN